MPNGCGFCCLNLFDRSEVYTIRYSLENSRWKAFSRISISDVVEQPMRYQKGNFVEKCHAIQPSKLLRSVGAPG